MLFQAIKKPLLRGHYFVLYVSVEYRYLSHPPQPSISISFITGAKTLLKILVNHYGIIMMSRVRN